MRDTLEEIHTALPWPRQRLPPHRGGGDPSIIECWRIDAKAAAVPVPPSAPVPPIAPIAPTIAEENANAPAPAEPPRADQPAHAIPDRAEAVVTAPIERVRKQKEPVPLPEGDRRFLVFRRVRNERLSQFWSVSIRMPNGYTELIDTGTRDKLEARNQGSIRVIRLYKELDLPRPSAAKAAATATSAPVPAPPPEAPAPESTPAVPRRRGRPPRASLPVAAAPPLPPLLPAPPSIALARRADAGRLETAYAAGLGEIAEALLMQEDQNPEAFIRHVRDVVAGAIRTARHGGK